MLSKLLQLHFKTHTRNSLHEKMDRPPFKSRASPLPSYANAIEEKQHLTTRPSRFFTTFYIPVGRRRLAVPLPIPPSIWMKISNRLGKQRASVVVWLFLLGIGWLLLSIIRRLEHRPRWTNSVIGDPPTLVYSREDLRRIWQWEIASGHYPSTRPSASQISCLAMPC